jgi:Surface lipoprotein assembly modifier
LQLRFDLTLRPSDNVNGGARDPLFVLRGIPLVLSRDALALSGANWGAGVQGRYRLAASPNGETAVTFDLSHQGVLLSEEARKQANEARLLASQVFPFPEFVEIKNGDYALDHAEVGLEKLFGADPAPGLPGQWSLGTTAGQTWYAGRRLSVDYGASIGFARQFDKFAFSTDLGLRKHDRQDHDISSSTDLSLAASLSFKGRAGDQWQASLSHEAVSSKDISIDHQEIGLNLGWRAGKRLAGVGLGASLGVRQVDYAASPYTATGRQDQRLQASITAEISKLSYLGFAPVLGLDYSRSRSNVALYDSAALGVTLSIKSQF